MSHINSFPTFESNYSRQRSDRKYLNPGLNLNILYKLYVESCKNEGTQEQDIAKLSYYRHLFNTEFNLSFKMPYHDTCDTCDKAKRDIQEARVEDRPAIKEHHKNDFGRSKQNICLKGHR